MSQAEHEKPIENAGAIIERFGGIRPMATKTGVAVTTIQGWKKRDVIPANRLDDILKAAKLHGVDVSGLIPNISNENESVSDVLAIDHAVSANDEDAKQGGQDDGHLEGKSQDDEQSVEGETEEDAAVDVKPVPKEDNEDVIQVEVIQETIVSEDDQNKDVVEEVLIAPEATPPQKPSYTEIKPMRSAPDNHSARFVVEEKKQTNAKKLAGVFGVLVLILGAGAMMLIPKSHKDDVEDGEYSEVAVEEEKPQTDFKGLVPEDWTKQLSQLKQELQGAKDIVSPVISDAKRVAGELVNGNTGEIEQRVEKLQSYVNEITKSTSLSDLYARLDTMRSDIIGQKGLDQSMSDLYALFSGVDTKNASDKDTVNAMLERGRSQSESLGQTFADVPPEDLKAAAMLLALTQMRSTLSRENVPFAQDLDLLLKMTGDDDVELRAALLKLAPHAERGVLTPTGLSEEFRGLAGDVVVSSLKGEDVSLMEKAQARMNDFLAVEKDGELVSGTPTQAAVNKAQKQLDAGRVDQAVSLLQEKLTPSELEPLKPWMRKAEALMSAQNAQSAIQQAIELNLGRGYLGGSQLIKQE